MKYLCLIYEEESTLNGLAAEDWRELRQRVLDYVETLRASGRLIDAQPLRSAGTASTLRMRNGRLSVTDGPFAETKEQIGGFFLIEADTFDEAVDIASKWPSAHLASIEVRPIEEGLPQERRYA